MDRMDMTKSLDIRQPHFQKDIIIPEIYNLENIKLIQSCKYPDSPINKVKELKKKNIQNLIKAIVNKPYIINDNSHKKHTLKKKSKQTEYDDKSYKEIYETQGDDGLFMDIDEQIGEFISNMEENFAPTSERIQNVLSKVSKHIKNRGKEEKEKEVLKYLQFISSKNQVKVPNPQKKKVKGLLEELEDLRKSGVKSPFRKRVQSAKVIRNTPQNEDFMMRQTTSRLLQRNTSNLKEKQNFSAQIAKSKQLITMINICLDEQEKTRTSYTKSLSQMKEQWSEHSKLQKTLLRSTNFTMTSDTLNILREKRLKQHSIARIDKQILKK